MFVDEVDIHVEAGDGGRGCLALPPREVRPARRPERRRRRSRRLGLHRRQPAHQHPHQFPVPSRVQRRARRARQGSNRTGRRRRRISNCRSRSARSSTRRPAEPASPLPPARRPHRRRAARARRAGRTRRPRQRPLRDVDQPRAAQGRSRASRAKIKDLRLELKLLADVGLVGFPNAGKSTLISRISAARPKIADYPFTTLTPNLGVVASERRPQLRRRRRARADRRRARGQGLGHQFLRHLERTKVLVHLVDVSGASGRDPVEDFDIVRRELELFDADARGEAADRRREQDGRGRDPANRRLKQSAARWTLRADSGTAVPARISRRRAATGVRRAAGSDVAAASPRSRRLSACRAA